MSNDIAPCILSLTKEESQTYLHKALRILTDGYKVDESVLNKLKEHEDSVYYDLKCMICHCGTNESFLGLYYRIRQEGLFYYYNSYTSIQEFSSLYQFMRCHNYLDYASRGVLDEHDRFNDEPLALYIFEKCWQNDCPEKLDLPTEEAQMIKDQAQMIKDQALKLKEEMIITELDKINDNDTDFGPCCVAQGLKKQIYSMVYMSNDSKVKEEMLEDSGFTYEELKSQNEKCEFIEVDSKLSKYSGCVGIKSNDENKTNPSVQ